MLRNIIPLSVVALACLRYVEGQNSCNSDSDCTYLQCPRGEPATCKDTQFHTKQCLCSNLFVDGPPSRPPESHPAAAVTPPAATPPPTSAARNDAASHTSTPPRTLLGPTHFCQGLSPGGGESCMDIPDGCYAIAPLWNYVPQTTCTKSSPSSASQHASASKAPPDPTSVDGLSAPASHSSRPASALPSSLLVSPSTLQGVSPSTNGPSSTSYYSPTTPSSFTGAPSSLFDSMSSIFYPSSSFAPSSDYPLSKSLSMGSSASLTLAFPSSMVTAAPPASTSSAVPSQGQDPSWSGRSALPTSSLASLVASSGAVGSIQGSSTVTPSSTTAIVVPVALSSKAAAATARVNDVSDAVSDLTDNPTSPKAAQAAESSIKRALDAAEDLLHSTTNAALIALLIPLVASLSAAETAALAAVAAPTVEAAAAVATAVASAEAASIVLEAATTGKPLCALERRWLGPGRRIRMRAPQGFCFTYTGPPPNPPLNEASIPSRNPCTNKNGQLNTYLQADVTAAIQQARRYQLGNQLATKNDYPHIFQNTPGVDTVTYTDPRCNGAQIFEFPIIPGGPLQVGSSNAGKTVGTERVLFFLDAATQDTIYCGIITHSSPTKLPNPRFPAPGERQSLDPFSNC